MSNPLAGIRVLDLTNVLAGPFCCHQLAHLGAEVIKVETPLRGDLARQLGADTELNAQRMGVSFLAQNAGKKSVTINLKHQGGKTLFRQLLKTADVLVENFRPGVMQRLKLDYDHLKPDFPDLVYCAISGFGQDGPWVNRPAYDQIIQGLSGAMSITGDHESAPLRTGFPIADTVGGMTAAFAIAAALNQKPRGSFLDVSMLESLLSTMGWAISNYLIAGVEPQANGNENPTSSPSGTFLTSDGLLNIAANKDEQWHLLTEHLGLDLLQHQSRFRTREDRKTNRVALRETLENVLKTRPAHEWADELNAIGVPAGAVLSVPEILQSAQIQERGFIREFDCAPGNDRSVRVAGTGFKLDGEALSVDSPPPTLGEHNDSVFAELGLTEAEIQDLKTTGAI